MKLYSFKAALISIVFISFLAFNLPEQSNRLLKKITDSLEKYYDMDGPEKAFLETDKDMYVLGDTIWFKTYVVDGITHQASKKSKVAYVEMLNDNDSIVEKRRLFVEGTSGFGDILLSKMLNTGAYRLRTYTNYMLNDEYVSYFEKSISIATKSSSMVQVSSESVEIGNESKLEEVDAIEVDLMFFPEGGDLVTGVSGVLGIKALDSRGVGQALKGSIHSTNGDLVAEFETAEFGLGKVNIIPKKNTDYYARINKGNEDRRFNLPVAKAAGYSLNIKNWKDNLLLQVTTTKGNSLEGTLLIGHLRGELIFKKLGTGVDKDSYAVRLLTEELQEGIAQFTLFSSDGNPICERLVFVDHPGIHAEVIIKTNKDNFVTKEKVNLDISVLNKKGNPLQGDFLTSVIPATHQLKQGNMGLKGWLLLNSDLGGTVVDPDFFFSEDTKQKRFLLDALLLTHGWRRFVWKEMLGDEIQKDVAYVPEKGIMIKGTMVDYYHPSMAKSVIAKFNVLEEALYDEQVADEKGQFSFGPYYFNDSITAIIQAVDTTIRAKSAQKNIAIIVEEWPDIPKTAISKDSVVRDSKIFKIEEFYSQTEYPSSYFLDEQDLIKLNPVSIKAKKISRARFVEEELNKTTPYGRPDIRVFRDSVSGWQTMSVLGLLQRRGAVTRAGTSMMTSTTSNSISAVGPLVLFNGTSTSITLAELNIMRANEVVYVDIIRGYNSGASMYGARGMFGVIAIYTNPPSIEGLEKYNNPIDIPGIKTARITGFYKACEFYSPNYSEASTSKTELDYRTTLFWDPKVNLSKDGKTQIQFYTGDVTGDFMVKFQGISDTGKLVTGSHYFTVDNSL
ncbi:hypothetical protein [Maribacter sp. ACAM166]|uniref:hypothetical protein n=1 Tax=Maribacter sp. ACAM166 TaxID=2508996 RepID=UPI0010FECF3A|nr:hypothetical protein [Maribacter sp. ACAM166]TLP78774.1 hypothetical protein ES765_12055 [Maribacter sp. ACAM166]